MLGGGRGRRQGLAQGLCSCLPRPANLASQRAACCVTSQEMIPRSDTKPRPRRSSAPCQVRGPRWQDKAYARPFRP